VHNKPNSKGETPQRTIELVSDNPSMIYAPNGKLRNVQILKDMKAKFGQSFPICI